MKKNQIKALRVESSSKKWSGGSRYGTSPLCEENGATSTEAYRAATMKCVVYTLLSPISEWFQVYTHAAKNTVRMSLEDQLDRACTWNEAGRAEMNGHGIGKP